MFINILFVEDSVDDCDLLLEHFKENGYLATFKRIENELEMVNALAGEAFDIILCDHNLPNFDVFSALAVAKEWSANTPFFVVSGFVSEEAAVQSVESGAKDYILKNNLSRLIPAVAREIAEAKTRFRNAGLEFELRKKEYELQQVHKFEAVGQLAGGIAHDFNNILSFILMQVERSIEIFDTNSNLKFEQAEIYKCLHKIQTASERATGLTRQLLAFSRKQTILPKILSINKMIREMGKMLSCMIEENIKFELDLDGKVENIKIDPSHLQQIIMNLVVNSRDALPRGGSIRIQTMNTMVSEIEAEQLKMKAGGYTLMQVSDTGTGMSEEVQRHIFDPLFTTKAVGQGTGLGLSTVYGIVKQCNGYIFVESTPNVGSVFKVYLPQSDEAVTVDNSVNTSAHISGAETILVAEDELELRTVLSQMLTQSGYKVLEASDGQKAVELLSQYKDEVHLIITDVVMPNMGGLELSEKVRELRPKIKFLFLSGYVEDAPIISDVSSGLVHFVEKPYVMKTLLQKVQQIIRSDKLNAVHDD